MSVIEWWNDGSRTSEWAMRMLPALARQASSQRPITYGALAAEVGMSHHRPVQRAAGHIARALIEVGKRKGWRRRPPPPLQSLIVNRETGLPGSGIDTFMSRRFRAAKTKSQREAALLTAHGEVFSYPYWAEVLALLDVVEAAPALDELSDEATASRGRGGEGPEHRALKEFVAANPTLVGLPPRHPAGLLETPLPSGDRVDVTFSSGARITAVEVKSAITDRGDLARGIYQCVKYRAVLEARSAISQAPLDVSVSLVVGCRLPSDLRALANAFAIPVVDEVVPR